MADITQITRGLASRAQSVAEYLLPNGRREGNEWRVGSIGGEAGKSLGLHLTGDKAGVWADFGSNDKGDLLDLWSAVRRVSLADAIIQAREWLGLARPEPYRQPEKSYVRPPKPVCTAAAGRVLDYLTEDRNIPAEILARYKIGAAGQNIVFPFLLPDGTLAMAKVRKAADNEDPKPTAANCEPVLFGWQAIPATAREIVITEGEIDALSWAAYGYAAMSVPYGGGSGAKQQWIENEFERMDRFERIYIATDMDKTGEDAAEEIANRLGRHRCLRVKMPRKDGNACLMDGVTAAEIEEIIRTASSLDPEGLRRPSDLGNQVVQLFWPSHETHVGYRMPYGKLRDKFLLRPAEVTLWGGESGAGKSQILSDCIVDWIGQGSRVCLSSLEMKGAQTLKRMCKQVVGADRPTEGAIIESLGWLDHGLLLYERVGKASIDGLLQVFDYARAKYGCDQFVIDSLMRLGIAGDDYNGQEKAIFRLVEWTLSNGVHTHLVAHARKGARDRVGPGETEDIKGAMEIGANAFNIVIVWRNRRLEDDIKAAKTDDERKELGEKPNVIVNIAKQRNGDFEGKAGLWFDQSSYRYYATSDRGAWLRNYLLRGREAA